MVAKKLQTGAPQAYEAVNDIFFNYSQYEGLLRSVLANPTKSHYDIACDWMQNNKDTWIHWKQLRDNNELKIMGIFPFSSRSHNGPGIADAAMMAIDAINNNDTVLRDIKLVLTKDDGQCNTDTVMKTFIETVLNHNEFKRLIGILGKEREI